MNSGPIPIILRFSFLIPGLLLFRVAIAQDAYVANPFIQPNDSTLNWYGSGDANGDDTLTLDDVTRMQELIDGSFIDPNDSRLYDRADVNGDQIVNNLDKSMLVEHLDTEALLQPKWYWNKLKTREEKIEWLSKMLIIDKSEEACWDYTGPLVCDCNHYSNQMFLSFSGVEKTSDIYSYSTAYGYDTSNIGRFNLPVLNMTTSDEDSLGNIIGGHSMNSILIGHDGLQWSDLCNIEPQNDWINLQPGDYGLAFDYYSYVVIGGGPMEVIGSPDHKLLLGGVGNFAYEISKQIPSSGVIYGGAYWNNVYAIDKDDTICPEISNSIIHDSIYEISPEINIRVYDEIFATPPPFGPDPYRNNFENAFRQESWFAFDIDDLKYHFSDTFNGQLELPEGSYTMIIYSHDIYYNEAVDSIHFSVNDLYAPRISVESPTPDDIYGSSPVIKINIEEPNLSLAQYSLDSGSTWIEFARDTTFTPNLNLGDHTLLVGAEDSAGNNSIISVSFTVADLDAPSAPTGLIVENITTNSFDLFWDSSMDNVGVSGYRVFSGDTEEGTSSSNSYSFQDLSPNTAYSLTVLAYDEVGNESAKSSSITVTTVDPAVGNDFNAEFLGQVKIYPNPTYDLLYIETKDISRYSIEITSINGLLLYNQEVAGLIHQIDFSSFQKGVYFITIRSHDSVTTRKILKL